MAKSNEIVLSDFSQMLPSEEQKSSRKFDLPTASTAQAGERYFDAADDNAILAQIMGHAVDISDYVYSFQQGGKLVEGLSLIGVNEAANRKGSIKVKNMLFDDRLHSWLAYVTAIDTSTNKIHYGAFEQPKRTKSGKIDAFAFTKAVHKAQRNAIRQHLPAHLVREIINLYRMQKGISQLSQDENDEDEPPKHKITNAQKSAFAQANRLKKALLRVGITQDDLWNSIRKRFKVESRNDITEAEWTLLAAELNAAESNGAIFNEFVKKIKQAFADDDFLLELKSVIEKSSKS
ncbi:TPA: hypothetical protein EYP66_14550 [Candidatus Poribacteria bacterium]|nr:hypothetical protein [Candidatus Poribacteria bacterium]